MKPHHLRVPPPSAAGPEHLGAGPRPSRWLSSGAVLALTLALVSVPSFASADTEHEHHHGASEPLTSSELDVLAKIDADTIVDHIRYVEDEIGPGVGGSPAELRRAEYFAGQLEDLGYAQWSHATATDGEDDYFQFFEDPVVASGVTGSLTLNGREYPVTGPSYSDTGVYRGFDQPEITGETVYFAQAEDALAAPAEAIAGRIVLTTRPAGNDNASYAPIALELQDKGAAGVVFVYGKYTVSAQGKTSGERRFSAVTGETTIGIPVVLTSYFDGQDILAELTQEGEVASGSVTVRHARNTTSLNVLAVKPAAEPTERSVIVGAHLDSVVGAVGANDNLSGPAVILEIARAQRRPHRLQRRLRVLGGRGAGAAWFEGLLRHCPRAPGLLEERHRLLQP